MAEKQVSEMFNSISSKYDRVNRILSFGIDRSWRRKMASLLPDKTPIKLLDLATGTCDQLLSMMASRPIEEAVGIDLAKEMLQVGVTKVTHSPFANRIRLEVASALDIPAEEASFSCATISFGIRNVEDPLKALKEMRRVLQPGGRALILEFSLPKSRVLRALHLFYLRHVLPLVGGLVSGNRAAYSYLNKTIESFPHGEDFLALMKEAGFDRVEAIPMTFGVATIYQGDKDDRIENTLHQ